MLNALLFNIVVTVIETVGFVLNRLDISYSIHVFLRYFKQLILILNITLLLMFLFEVRCFKLSLSGFVSE